MTLGPVSGVPSVHPGAAARPGWGVPPADSVAGHAPLGATGVGRTAGRPATHQADNSGQSHTYAAPGTASEMAGEGLGVTGQPQVPGHMDPANLKGQAETGAHAHHANKVALDNPVGSDATTGSAPPHQFAPLGAEEAPLVPVVAANGGGSGAPPVAGAALPPGAFGGPVTGVGSQSQPAAPAAQPAAANGPWLPTGSAPAVAPPQGQAAGPTSPPQSPAAGATPPPGGPQPPAAGATPPPGGPQPPAAGATPPPGGPQPPAAGATPPPGGPQPPAAGATPPPGGPQPPAAGANPPPGGPQPPAAGANPPPGGPQPPAAGANPPPGGPQPPPGGNPPGGTPPPGSPFGGSPFGGMGGMPGANPAGNPADPLAAYRDQVAKTMGFQMAVAGIQQAAATGNTIAEAMITAAKSGQDTAKEAMQASRY
jgi:hypothetical protein